ncbi:hypothetical protein [Bifidobacterium breve]|uniref:hypothetical protein n=1 Tax=Bifidobacterium breve TaxID=1685 RepID=UPI0012D7D389|nr:hypothetical protein [Bifidobacterium breve]
MGKFTRGQITGFDGGGACAGPPWPFWGAAGAETGGTACAALGAGAGSFETGD